ncbi:MAG: hypothetical protein QM594_19030 [Niabella sp.]
MYNEDNLKREIEGLTEAIKFLKLKKGRINTFNQSDVYMVDGLEIKLVSLSVFLTE